MRSCLLYQSHLKTAIAQIASVGKSLSDRLLAAQMVC